METESLQYSDMIIKYGLGIILMYIPTVDKYIKSINQLNCKIILLLSPPPHINTKQYFFIKP